MILPIHSNLPVIARDHQGNRGDIQHLAAHSSSNKERGQSSGETTLIGIQDAGRDHNVFVLQHCVMNAGRSAHRSRTSVCHRPGDKRHSIIERELAKQLDDVSLDSTLSAIRFSRVGKCQEYTSDRQRERRGPSVDCRADIFLVTHIAMSSEGNTTIEEVAHCRGHDKREIYLADIAGTGKDKGRQSSRTTGIEALCR